LALHQLCCKNIVNGVNLLNYLGVDGVKEVVELSLSLLGFPNLWPSTLTDISMVSQSIDVSVS
jgi:hypothetical protein